MLRINQFAKEMGVPNQEIIDLLEKRLGVTGKSHSSNLSEEQAQQLKRALDGRGRGEEDGAPLARHKPTATVKVVKTAAKPPEPAPEPPAPPKSAPILLKKAEHRPAEPVQAAPSAPPAPVEAPPPSPAPVVEEPTPAAAPAAVQAVVPEPAAPSPVEVSAEPPAETTAAPAFSRLRISETAAPAPKPQEPARYIQLPPQAPAKVKPEPGAKPMVQRPGQSSQVQRSGMPQPEKTVLPMATNTGKGEVMKHEALPPVTSKRLSNLPSIADLRPDQGFSRIKMADAPTPTARPQQPPRYIQLPQQRPGPGSSSRPGGPGARPGGPGRPGMGPRPGGPGRPGMGPRPGGPGRPGMGRPGTGPAPGPIDPNASKGPGRTA
ncbi:MAG: translation initiation factor IF-2 N-terminal domain-containing protein, partial [Caulobacterales bacterium]|nr:translation initiation factor IF-2 N-terminal domain-containing protein [Caulobacterales bacterium]